VTIEPSDDKSQLAVLVFAVKTLTDTVNKNHEEDNEWREAYAGRLRTAENDITALKTITGVWNGINSIGAVIATYLGLKQ
jgi:hypothetical protein